MQKKAGIKAQNDTVMYKFYVRDLGTNNLGKRSGFVTDSSYLQMLLLHQHFDKIKHAIFKSAHLFLLYFQGNKSCNRKEASLFRRLTTEVE